MDCKLKGINITNNKKFKPFLSPQRRCNKLNIPPVYH